MNTRILFEFSVVGIIPINPSYILVSDFKPNLFELKNGVLLFLIEIIRLILTGYIFIFLILFKCRGKSFNGLFKFNNIVSILTNLGIIGLIFFNFANGLILSSKSREAILTEKSGAYVNMTKKAQIYNDLFVYESLIVTLSILRLLVIQTINQQNKIIFKTISTAVTQLVAYMLIILPLFLGFAALGMGIWGSSMKGYTNFWNAFLSVLLMTLG